MSGPERGLGPLLRPSPHSPLAVGGLCIRYTVHLNTEISPSPRANFVRVLFGPRADLVRMLIGQRANFICVLILSAC